MKGRRLKSRITARVDPEFHRKVSRFAADLGISLQKFVIQALVMEMGSGVELKKRVQQLREQLEATHRRKDDVVIERNLMRNELQMMADKLSVVEGDRDECVKMCEAYKEARDTFKAKYETAAADLRVVKAKLAGFEKQSFFDRVFGRAPVFQPYVEQDE